MVTKITFENFEQEVLKSDKPVLIDFYADWCVPCKMVGPVMEDISNTEPNIKVCKVNVDEDSYLANQFQILSIPMIVVMKDGKLINKVVGARNKQFYINLIR